MSSEKPPTSKNLIYLSAAAALCGGFWAWALFRTVAIHSYFPQDSRVGLVLFWCAPAWFMALVYQLRVLRVVLLCKSRVHKLRFSWPGRLLFLALNLVSFLGILSVFAIHIPILAVGAFFVFGYLWFCFGIEAKDRDFAASEDREERDGKGQP